jgi:HAE1 family hydrophobic/amphiphilic exporter-1
VPLTRFCLNNPVAATLFYAAVGAIGLVAFFAMGRSVLPPIAVPVVAVSAPYPGAGPQEIERLVLEPIEDEARALPAVSRVTSSAQNGIGELRVEFRFGTNLETDRVNVQQAVDAARPNLPADLVAPVVSKDDSAGSPVIEEAVSSVLLSQREISDIVTRRIVPALRAAPGAGAVQAAGTSRRQFWVEPEPAQLQAVHGTVLDLSRAIAAGNDVFPGGRLRSRRLESAIGIDASAVTVAQIEALPVAVPGSFGVRVGDVARVFDTVADRDVIARVDGDEAVVLSVSSRSGADTTATVAAIRKVFARLSLEFPELRFEELRTDVPQTDAAIGGVLQTLGEGVVLTVAVMLLFLHSWRNALVAAISIPSSIAAAFVAMWATGMSLNVLSLMGLSLTIGILVDDSIVIIEAIAAHAAGGLRADDAALAGRAELGGAAVAITLVDVVVFTPIAVMNGLVGEFMRQFGIVVVLATGFSLLVSLTLTPLLSARWALATRTWRLDGSPLRDIYARLRARSKTFPWMYRTRVSLVAFAGWHAVINAFNAWERDVAERYARVWLPAALERRGIVFAGAAAAFVLSLLPPMLGAIPSEFSPPVNRGETSVQLIRPAGTPVENSDASARQIAAGLLNDPAVRHVETSAGWAFDGTTGVFAGNVAQIAVVFADPNAGTAAVEREIAALAREIPDAVVVGGGKGMGGRPAVAYAVGGSGGALEAAARKLADRLRANPYAIDVHSSDYGVQPYVRVAVDMGKAQLLDINPDDAAQTARIAAGGAIVTKDRLDSGLTDVVVRSGAARLGDLDALRRFDVRSGTGTLVPLEDVSTVDSSAVPAVVERQDGERIVTVSANAIAGAPISLVSAPLARALRDPAFLPAGAHIEPRGDLEQFLETVSRIGAALALSIVAIYAILAVLYRSYVLPLVIMLTVPLASAGALGALAITNRPMNLYSMLGIVMLVGLVAKNGILLVEYAERGVRGGIEPARAVTAAAERRFRPIVMTTCAMIAGMAPLALGHAIGAEYRSALGTVVVGGLLTSLLLTLFVVPAAYVAYRRRGRVPVRRSAAAHVAS